MGLLRLVFNKELLVFVGRFFWIGLFGIVRKLVGGVVCRSSLFIIVVWLGDMVVGNGEGLLRIGYFIFNVVVVCINIGDVEFIGCCMGCW